MKKKGIYVVLCVIGFVVALFFILNQSVINCYDGSSYSKNIEQSKKNKFFISEYCPLYDSISLIGKKIKAPKCWVEKSWNSKHFLLFFQTTEIKSGYCNLIIADTSENQKHEYMYVPDLNGLMITNNNKQGYVLQYPSDINEFIVQVVQPSKEEGWAKEIIVDSVVYVKCK